MSDHEEGVSETGYFPISELDDHRHQSPSTQIPDRPRRGTFDTLYGARQMEQGSTSADHGREDGDMADIRVRDFEEVIVDEDGADESPQHRRSRRPTVDTQRTASPPNSVKAFAEARRREREMSFSEPNWRADDDGLHRTVSAASRRSLRSRPRTVDNETVSLASHKSAQDDVCFPVQEEYRKDGLHIDYEYLEDFIASQRMSRVVSDRESEVRVFSDLRHQSSAGPTGSAPASVPVSALQGDLLGIPLDVLDDSEQPKTADEPVEAEKPHQVLDPNRICFFSSAWESTIHAAELGDLVLPGEDVRGLFELPREEGGVWWLNVNNPSKEEVGAICKAFGTHPLTTEDIATQESREKIELFPSYYFACFRSFNTVADSDGYEEYEPFNIYAIVFREGTLSFSFAPNGHASNVRKRIALLKDFVALSSDWICYALIDDIVDSFAPVIHRIEVEVDGIEDSVFMVREDDSNDFLRRTGRTRKNIMALMRLIGGKADVLKGFTKRCNENYKVTPRMDIGLYLGDIQDHVVTMMINLGHFEKMLSRAHSNYLAQLSINNISQGTETNKALSKITFLGSVLVPLNLISGMFGMNVHVPFQDKESLIPFFGIMGVMIIVCVACLMWARRYRYI